MEFLWQAAGLYVLDVRVIAKDHGFETLQLFPLGLDFGIVLVLLEPLDKEILIDVVLLEELLFSLLHILLLLQLKSLENLAVIFTILFGKPDLIQLLTVESGVLNE